MCPGCSSGRMPPCITWSTALSRPTRWTRRPTGPGPTRSRSGLVGLLDALVRLATAWVLLKIRHRGPGLWWSAICVTLAVGVFYDPISGIAPGGLASVPGMGIAASDRGDHAGGLGPALPGARALDPVPGLRPGAAGAALVADPPVRPLGQLGRVVPDRAAGPGRGRRRPLARRRRRLDRASAEPTFPSGKPGDGAAGGRDRHGRGRALPGAGARAFLVLGLCVAACLANPWTYRVFTVADHPLHPADPAQRGHPVPRDPLVLQRGRSAQQGGYLWTS